MHGDPVYRNSRWSRLSRAVRFGRELGYCEICRVSHGAIAPNGRSLVFLNCAHLNGDVTDLRPENLGALCPRCHFLYDQFRRVGALARKHPALREFLAGRTAKTRRTPRMKGEGPAGRGVVSGPWSVVSGNRQRAAEKGRRKRPNGGAGALECGGLTPPCRRGGLTAKRRTATAQRRAAEERRGRGDEKVEG